MKSSRGFILIVVLSLLGVLAFLAIGFVMSSQNSKALSANTLNKIKARLMARSGIEKILANSPNMLLIDNSINFEQNPLFSGEDLNRNGNVSVFEDSLANNNGLEETFELPLEDALCPSFALKDMGITTQDQALLININGKSRGISWRSPQDEVSRIKITAFNNRIDLNGGFVPGTLLADRTDYDSTFGETWSATEFDHAYNRPTVNFLNALGNYYLYINRDGADDPARTYMWDMPGDPSDINGVTIDNVRNNEDLDGVAAAFSPTFSYPLPDDPGTPDDEILTLGGLGHHLIRNRPELGFSSIEEVKSLAIEWAEEHSELDPDEFWSQISKFLDTSAQPRNSTRLWRQEILEPLESGRYGNFNQTQMAKTLGVRGNDRTRAWLTTRSYRQPRSLVNINTAPIPVLAALIYAVKDIQYRHVSYDDTYALTRPLFMANRYIEEIVNFEAGITIYENQVMHSSPMEYAGPNMDLFSMTESIQMAKTIAKERSQKRFTSYQELYDFLATYPYGYDAKTFDAAQGNWGEEALGEGLYNFHDLFTSNERERLLWCVLNPNGNLRHFVFDEALPLTTNCKEFRYAHHEKQPGSRYRERRAEYGQIDFDKSYPHEFATEISFFDEGNFKIESQGLILDPNGEILSQSKITTSAKLFEALHFTNQEDFALILNKDGSSITNSTQFVHNAVTRDWITYPELHTAAPSVHDGQLALAPTTFTDIPGLGTLKSHHPFNPYHQPEQPYDTGALNHPAKQQEPSPAPEWITGSYPSGSFVLNDNQQGDYFTPWQPAPTDPNLNRSLLSPTSNSSDLEITNHFFPGGGIHPDAQVSTPLDGVPGETEISNGRRLGGLVLDATNTSGSYLIANSHEGAVSFFFKPRHYPLDPYTVIKSESPVFAQRNYRRHDRTPYCLFDYHFYISDPNVAARIINELEDSTYNDPPFQSNSIDPRADLYRCNIRLLYGQMWSTVPEEFFSSGGKIKKSGPLRLFPLNGNFMPGYAESEIEAWMHNIEQNVSTLMQETSFPKISTPDMFGFLFNDMNGMPLPFKTPTNYYGNSLNQGGGYLQRGDLIQNFYDVVGDPYHKYVSDKLWLEFRVSQVIESQTQQALTTTNQNKSYKQRIDLSPIEGPAYNITSSLDLYDNEELSFVYVDFGNTSNNDNFFSGDPSIPGNFEERNSGSHTVVKSFRLDYPIVLDPDSENFALGPEDSHGDPQAMVNHGRWHHFLITWRNMDSLLQFNKPNHKGGAIALYHNGTFKKDVVTGDSVWPYRGMFWNTDFYPGYWQNTSYNSDDTFSDGVYYGENDFTIYPMDVIYPTTNRTPLIDTNVGSTYELLPTIGFPGSIGQVSIKGFGMEANNDYHPRGGLIHDLNLLSVNPGLGQNYWLGSTGHYSGLQYFNVNGTQRVNEVNGLMRHASNKFFFGSAPHCVDDWTGNFNQFLSYKYIADGNFMDVRIANNAASLHDSSGGFVANIPNYDQVSPYPPLSESGRLFPFASTSLSGSRKLLGFHWTAYLPPFHRFWDDTNGIADVWNEQIDDYDINVPNFPGPDENNQLSLAANLETLNGGVWQRVNPGPENDLYLEQAKPLKVNKNFHVFSEPISLPNDQSLSLNLQFRKNSPPGVSVNNFSTPLIDDFTFYYTPEQGMQITMWQQN